MESKKNKQQNAMISSTKPKNKISLQEKKDTWGNLLNKRCTSTNTIIGLNKKPSNNDGKVKKAICKSVQCNLSNILPNVESCHNSNSLSGFNSIRTLQFLLKEIMEIPNVKNTGITKIVNEMQAVIERISDECSINSKLFKPNMDDSMIPTRENDISYLKYDNNPQGNKYWLVLLEKISELENNYSQLTKNYTYSGEKLQNITSERDKLLEKFKESCNSLETLNNREQDYLKTIAVLKAKVMASEKLISKQEVIIINLNNKLNNLSNKSPKLANEKISSEDRVYETRLKEKNQFKQNCNDNKFSLDKLKIANSFRDNQASKLRSDIQEMKQILLAGLETTNLHSISISSLKPDSNQKTGLSKCHEVKNYDIENNIDAQYNEYNRQASAIKLSKEELQQLFKTIKLQTYHSKKLFNSTFVDFEKDLSDISDEENNHSNFTSVVTDSSC